MEIIKVYKRYQGIKLKQTIMKTNITKLQKPMN